MLVQDGVVAEIFATNVTDLPPAEAVLDLHNQTLFPGFIDVHIHGAKGIDVMDTDPDGLDQVSGFLAGQGTTSWLPTLVPSANEGYGRAIAAIEELMRKQTRAAGKPGARALGVHYEGPFVNTSQCGALHVDYFQTFAEPQQVTALPVPKSPNTRRMMTLAPEVVGGVELVRELKQRGWIVSVGHTRADIDTLERAFDQGARHMTHFMNAMSPLHHRAPGPVAWGLKRDEVTCDFIADGIHLDPYVLGLLVKMKGSNGLVLISDAIAAAGEGDGEYTIWGEKISVTNGRTSNTRGSIAGSVITMVDAVRRMLSLGVPEIEVAQMAATNPARLLGISDEYGSIAVGKRADLVVLDERREVVLSLVGGCVAFQS